MTITIIDKTYRVIVNGEVQEFTTSLTESEFYQTLNAVYGIGNYQIVEVR